MCLLKNEDQQVYVLVHCLGIVFNENWLNANNQLLIFLLKKTKNIKTYNTRIILSTLYNVSRLDCCLIVILSVQVLIVSLLNRNDP